MKALFCLLQGCLLLFVFMVLPMHAVQADGWYWLSSDSKYSKYFDPSSVVVSHKAATGHGDVATEIAAWTKTAYSYEGAQETIENYGLNYLLPDPSKLSYSLAEVIINPQNRTIQYAKEDFYDPQGQVIWSKVDGRVKEVTSQQFDESFYDAIVDQVFGAGETQRAAAKDRWLTLWEDTAVDGSQTHVTADTTTMRMKGENMVVWEWAEYKDADGNVTQIAFMKKHVNLPQGTERTVQADIWTPAQGWQDAGDSLDGSYRMLAADTPEYQGLLHLREYAEADSSWIHRYAIW
ncbi:hypothetical protein [uncultured Mitsuokella sp.]|uniref:hypothetical protein n=1 Tax=uncultured Mitsuokella sp. TaxID=453120 RepID=UPI0025E713A7|nr:hypothetical protein [uncultured Mitsuokella sp.]